MKDTANTVMERCDLLVSISEEPGLIVRATTVFGDGRIVSEPGGRLVRPEARIPSGLGTRTEIKGA